ncbi:class I SAM-dependent methyltransferase (plasmid) [Microvirga terrae]|uniref:Class I SAM-dependent methyltransferase n=1 Tax=Microvirga terrae TaxID=2740529 RepID=A0ABY5S0V1_9HYPH|nr:class I SAM-dependent methyltransferase [Microvirga terrae]UVF22206.1 class I SAM-dependent methyltransferase [Microvirga terrae]
MVAPEQVDQAVVAGQAVYTPRTLDLYDLVVLGLSNALIWKCPTGRLLEQYNRHVAARHLDVGVGTGWFLDHCRFPNRQPQITLLDLNQACLARAAARISRYQPKVVQANVLEPIGAAMDPFASIGLNYVLHCLPGPLVQKAVVFDHLKPFLAPGGVVFGSTLLSEGVERSRSAQVLMRFYNKRGIFSNQSDGLEDLRRELAVRFDDVRVRVIGCAALFVAR